jgi:c-di-GMP-related signal transduction protein
MEINLDPRDTVFVARQPILDRSERVFGYELLYRAAATDTSCVAATELAAARVLTDACLTMGLETLTMGLPAFVNLSRPLLLSCAGTLLPPPATVLELIESMEIDQEVIEACRSLHGMGYALALDDFTPGSPAEKLLPYVKFVKVDVLATSPTTRSELVKRFHPLGVKLVAEKVETAAVAKDVRSAGYDLVQGYFFCKPATISSRTVPARRLAYLELLAALNRPNLTVSKVEDLIKHDASLSYRVLRCVNSAAFGIQSQVHSIREAVVLLGLDQIRKWASIWAVAGANSGGTPELATLALLRGRCCELLGKETSAEHGAELFLLGLCSLLDAILGVPMDIAVAELPLSPIMRQALLGRRNGVRQILDAVISYERGAWDDAEASLKGAGMPIAALSAAYSDSLQWARELSQHAAAAA